MRNYSKEDGTKKPEQAFKKRSEGTFIFRLYVSGTTSRSARAIENIKKLCEEYLKGRYELMVIDILKQTALLKEDQIIATPTLVKKLPKPIRKFIGDLSNTEKILVGLELKEK